MRLSHKGKVFVKAEIADSARKRAKGLMFRRQLGRNEGLLMVFKKPGRYGIWMPCMHFAIDVIWLDRGWRVVDVKKGLRPMGRDPRTWRVYYPKKPAQKVLEVAAGKAEGIHQGTILQEG